MKMLPLCSINLAVPILRLYNNKRTNNGCYNPTCSWHSGSPPNHSEKIVQYY